MNRLAVTVCFLLALAFSAAGQKTIEATTLENNASPAENVSRVQREVFDYDKYPALTAVGRVNFIGQSWCTIVLVAEDIAVTAGHCVLKANFKFDVSKDFDPFWTSVNFRPNGKDRLENVSIRRVLKAKLNPDYAIVRLSRKISASEIKPLTPAALQLDELQADEAHLGCAGFNGDKELGGGGFLMTISRNVKVIAETSSKTRVDTNCFSTYGGSGGLFYREKSSAESGSEYDFLGVIWGLTDEKFNERGELVKDENVTTSVTPVGVFYDELTEIIKKSREADEWQKTKIKRKKQKQASKIS